MNRALRLRAVTARGLGSYLRGARLDIGELTILCGTNGSGKSTWIRLLDILKKSADPSLSANDRRLPFRLVNDLEVDEEDSTNDIDDDVRERNRYPNHRITSSILDESERGDPIDQGFKVDLGDAAKQAEYGPLGTVGLEFQTTAELRLPSSREGQSDASTAGTLVWSGRCPAETTIVLRFTDPTQEMNEDVHPTGFELRVVHGGREEYVSFKRTPRGVNGRDLPEPGYAVTCSGGLLPGIEANGPVCHVVGIGRDKLGRRDLRGPHADDHRTRAFVDAVEDRVRELVWEGLTGYFHVSDIRTRQELVMVGHREFHDDHLAASRYVGRKGQNTHVLERRFSASPMRMRGLNGPEGYVFRDFYNFWLKRLVGAQVREAPNTRGEVPTWPEGAAAPSGQLVSTEPPKPLGDAVFSDSKFELEPRNLERYESAAFPGWKGAAPANMSSGFHQIAPLIVQTGLMQQNELLAVENPEVHLHPSLQLRIAEFFLEQLGDGKSFLIETHSDLFVRRVLRAILEEGIGGRSVKQEQVRIWFSSQENDGFSKLERMQVDHLGRIRNWPPGFMDEDVLESRRVLDAMYRARQHESGGPSQEEGSGNA